MRLAWIMMAMVGAAWAGKGPPAASWVDVGKQAQLCISSVPSTKMRGKDAKAFVEVVAQLTPIGGDEDAVTAWWAGQQEGVADWKEHPAQQVVAGTAGWLSGGTVEPLIELARSLPRDPCLQGAGALAILDSGGDLEEARSMLGRGWIAGRHPDMALMLSTVLRLQGESKRAAEVVEKGLKMDPEHARLRKLRVTLAAERGETDSIYGDLIWLRQQGDHELDEYLMFAHLRRGDIDEYLRIAVERGAPTGGLEGLGEAESPRAALWSHLGMKSDTSSIEAILHTNQGSISCTLLPGIAPITVANFVGLVEGTQPWVDNGETVRRPLYDGTVFHRVIPSFMIQGGDPEGRGTGGPGYAFHDEVAPDVLFDRRGRLAMANSGPGTNGSQFFVTAGPTPHLNGLHTIFGQCRDEATVDAIAGLSRDGRDKPFQEVVLERVELIRR